MGTTVWYNGVEMANVLTRQWDQSVQYDESRTDMLHHKFALRFEGVLHTLAYSPGEPLGAFANQQGAQAIDGRYRDVRELLMQPRGRLDVYMGTRLVFQCYPTTTSTAADPNRDVDNGPKPTDLSIVRVAGDRAFRVAFSIECAKVECPDSTRPVPLVLNNRWQLTEEIDANNFTTKNISGRLRLSIPGAITPNGPFQVNWRSLVVPPLEEGFRRDRMEFTCARNGLDCDYTVVDRQIHTAAPWPATKMQCAHSESTNDGITHNSEVTVRLEGPPDVDKRLLITRAIQVIDARLRAISPRWRNANGGPQVMGVDYTVENAYVTDHLGDEAVIEAGLRIKRVVEDTGLWLGSLRSQVLGTPLSLDPLEGKSYSPTQSTPPQIYGVGPNGEDRLGVIGLLQCYLQSPCNDRHEINPNAAPPTTIYESYAGGPPASEGDLTLMETNDVDKIRSAARHSVYTTAAVQNTYDSDDLTVVLPLAGAAGGGGDTCRAIQLGAGRCMRTITFDAERVGGWPLIPEPALSYADGSLRARRISHRLIPQPPTLTADSQEYVYRVRGEYKYALNRPPTRDEKLRTGALSFTEADVNATRFDQMESFDPTRGP